MGGRRTPIKGLNYTHIPHLYCYCNASAQTCLEGKMNKFSSFAGNPLCHMNCMDVVPHTLWFAVAIRVPLSTHCITHCLPSRRPLQINKAA